MSAQEPDLPAPPLLAAAPLRMPRRFSELLEDLARDHTGERLTVGDLLRAMEGRAIAALLFIFAFPNILPSPPGLAAVLGLPLVYLSFQLMLGRDPWLPRFISDRSMSTEAFRIIVARATQPRLEQAHALRRVDIGHDLRIARVELGKATPAIGQHMKLLRAIATNGARVRFYCTKFKP